MEFFERLGIDWRLLTAQLINFGILLFLLHRFFYKPVIEILEKRQTLIEKGIADAEQSRRELSEANIKTHDIILQARKEAEEIIKRAEKISEDGEKEALERTKQEVQRMIHDARGEIAAERKEMTRELKKELAALVVDASQRVLADVSDKKISRELALKALQEAETHV